MPCNHHRAYGAKTVILGVLPDRKKATVKAFLSGIPQHAYAKRSTPYVQICMKGL